MVKKNKGFNCLFSVPTIDMKKLKQTQVYMVGRWLAFLIDNIFVIFGGRIFQLTVGIHMGTNCDPLLADLFLY